MAFHEQLEDAQHALEQFVQLFQLVGQFYPRAPNSPQSQYLQRTKLCAFNAARAQSSLDRNKESNEQCLGINQECASTL